MRLYLSIHSFPAGAFTLEQVDQMAQLGQHDKVVVGYRSMGSLEAGKAVCTFEAPTEEDLANWFGKMGMPFDVIVPMEWEGERGDIRPL
jgi:hypothetical protein